jgi:GT2 family glycosyltransferase
MGGQWSGIFRSCISRAFGTGPGDSARPASPEPVLLTPAVSIGMAAHGNSDMTRRALDALFSSATGDFELILVDDKSPDDTLEVYVDARKRRRHTTIFSFTTNLEYCQSVNAFLSHARGEQLIFLSNDILVSPAYLRELLGTALSNPDCGVVHGCSNFVDNDSVAHNLPARDFDTREAFFAFAEEIAWQNRGNALIDERFLVGDAFLVSRRVIDRIGTFDTRFLGYYCDQDFGLRAQIAGFRIVLQRAAFALHKKDANIKYLPPDEQQEKLGRRHARVSSALGEFLRKYRLSMAEASVHDIPWEQLARQTFDPALHYVRPADYSEFALPPG